MSNSTLVIIPAFNEEEALPGVLKELAEQLTDVDVLVIDDGSRDSTAAIARKAGVLVASLPFNLGVGAALRTGFRFAVDHDYERAVQLDADGQHDPAAVTALLEALDSGADLAVGSRFASPGSDYTVSAVRSGGMRFLRLAIRILAGRTFTDTSSGFRAFSQPLLAFFAADYPAEYLGDTVEALLLAIHAGFDVVEVPVEMRRRTTGTPSSRNLRLLYHYIRLVIALLSTAGSATRRAA